MASKLKDKTIVITGASSGIGRSTALKFAEEGANLVLVARREAALDSLATACQQKGVTTLVVPADVSDKVAVENLARQAFDKFGRIDVWVNNAGVYNLGRFEDIPYDEFRRMMEVNFWGYVHGAYAVLPYFRRQRHGKLIMTASVASKITYPYATSYAASKHAVYAFASALRQELMLDPAAKNIHISLVMPATIDTPLFKHTANHTGRAVKAMPPVYPPEQVARAIVNMAKLPRREAFVGNGARMFRLTYLLAPALADRLYAKVTDKEHFYKNKTAPETPGNLFTPIMEGATEAGGWGGQQKSKIRLALGGLAAAIPLALVWQRFKKEPAKKKLFS
jgi:short-subunit dehydrogenase